MLMLLVRNRICHIICAHVNMTMCGIKARCDLLVINFSFPCAYRTHDTVPALCHFYHKMPNIRNTSFISY